MVGTRIGVGKEADVYIASSKTNVYALKFHKLGLTSFKTAKQKRGYLEKRKNASWMHMSRLSAMREFGFLVALKERGFSCPTAHSLNRHCVVMDFVGGFKMCQLRGLTSLQAKQLGTALWWKMIDLLQIGVVHGDLNEYNVICSIKEEYLGVIECENDDQKEQVQNNDQNENNDQIVENELIDNNEQLLNNEEFEENEKVDEVEENNKVDYKSTSYQQIQQQKLDQLPERVEEDTFYKDVIVIDFPQMINYDDKQAADQFDRDIDSYESFLNRRFQAQLQLPRFYQIIDLLNIKQEITANEQFVKQVIQEKEQQEEQVYTTKNGKNVQELIKLQDKKIQQKKENKQKFTKGFGKNKKDITKNW